MNTEGVKPENPELKKMISLSNGLLHCFISNSTLSEIIETAREWKQWTRIEFIEKDNMKSNNWLKHSKSNNRL